MSEEELAEVEINGEELENPANTSDQGDYTPQVLDEAQSIPLDEHFNDLLGEAMRQVENV